ncbi:hypothetical protein Tco_1452536, partial [Tanacetum coccineum]
SEGLQDYKFLIQVLVKKIKRLRRQETPRIIGDDSARSEPTEVADSNNFKPLLKEKRLKEQTAAGTRHKGKKETLDVDKEAWNKSRKALRERVVRLCETVLKNKIQSNIRRGIKAQGTLLWRRKRIRGTKKERSTQGLIVENASKRHKVNNNNQTGTKTNKSFVLVKDTEMGVKVVWGRNLYFEVKKKGDNTT